MEEMVEKIEDKKKKSTEKKKKIAIILIAVSALVILGCGYYLFSSYHMLKKYNVNSFKLDGFEIPTFNSALKSKKKLIVAIEEKDKITLKYDISKAKLNDVFAYLEKLSGYGFAVTNLGDTYIRAVNTEKDIQLRIKTSTNHLIFEYNIGIDHDEDEDIKVIEDGKIEQEEEKESSSEENTKTE